MKKSNLFAGLMGLALATFGFSSCADDDFDAKNNNTNNSKETLTATLGDKADYTFIMISTSGGNLDYSISDEMLQNYKGFGEKVKFAGIYKPSSKVENALAAADMGGTRYFEMKLKDGVTAETVDAHRKADRAEFDKIKSMSAGPARDAAEKTLWEHSDTHFLSDLVNSKYAEISLDLSDPNAIADVIKTVAKRNPAKKYILVTDNHGGGWSVQDDMSMTSRAQVFDDYHKDKNGNDKGISLDQLNAGIQSSGVKFEAIFCDLCLMAYIENLTGYQQNFKFCIASSEVTTGSMVGNLGTRLAKAGADITDDQLYSELSSWVQNDEYKNDWQTYSQLKQLYKPSVQSMGVYDLRKIGSLTAAMKQISNWYIKAYDTPAYKKVIDTAVLSSNYVTNPLDKEYDDYGFYEQRNKFVKDSLHSSTDEVIKVIVNDEKDSPVYKNIVKSSNTEGSIVYKANMAYGITFSHFVRTTLQLLKNANINNTETTQLNTLYNNYQTALKSMASIKCSHADFSGMDAYVWTSPTISLYSMNPSKFYCKDVVTPVDAATHKFTLNEALASYHNTKFDQETGWSNFLQKLTVSPSVLTNPIRTTAMYAQALGK